MLPPEPNDNGNSSMGESTGARPPQRAEGEGDEKPDGWEEPFPLGDTPWLLMLLLAVGYALRVGKKIGLRMPGTGK